MEASDVYNLALKYDNPRNPKLFTEDKIIAWFKKNAPCDATLDDFEVFCQVASTHLTSSFALELAFRSLNAIGKYRLNHKQEGI